MIHETQSKLAGRAVTLKKDVKHFQQPHFGGSEYNVEDYWDRVSDKSWMFSDGNIAAMVYGIRTGMSNLPIDDEVLYGKVGSFGHLVHISEIEETE